MHTYIRAYTHTYTHMCKELFKRSSFHLDRYQPEAHNQHNVCMYVCIYIYIHAQNDLKEARGVLHVTRQKAIDAEKRGTELEKENEALKQRVSFVRQALCMYMYVCV